MKFMDPPPTTDTAESDLSGAPLQDWEKSGRTANIVTMSFNDDFSIAQKQEYTLWHANWEVYTGRFVSPDQDGIFLYDRTVGEGRMLDFNDKMQIVDRQEMHDLSGNWVIYSGDFAGTGRSQLLLYDPGSGNAQILKFASNLKPDGQQTYTNWGQNMVLYVGHFGMPSLSIMLYDPQAAQSTFMAFDQSLSISHQYTVKSWDQSWQILVGAFVDHSRCITNGSCSAGDDILVLDRQTGRIEQYAFSFGRKFQVFDNRLQAFVRDGVAFEHPVTSVDTTTFSLVTTLKTSIKDEELY